MVDQQWYFTKDELLDTPSINAGYTYEAEQIDRTKGCLYILAVAAKLNLPQLVIATACTFFHRFYMRHSMKSFPVYDIAATCLLVATKVEECTRRLKDFLNVCAQKAQKNDKVQFEENSKDFWKWKNTVLANETVLLEAICFDFSIDHPQAALLELASELDVPDDCVQRAWMLLYQALGMPYVLYIIHESSLQLLFYLHGISLMIINLQHTGGQQLVSILERSTSWLQICWITFKSITIFESHRLHLLPLLNHPITPIHPIIHLHHNLLLHTPIHHQAIAVSKDCIISTASST